MILMLKECRRYDMYYRLDDMDDFAIPYLIISGVVYICSTDYTFCINKPLRF